MPPVLKRGGELSSVIENQKQEDQQFPINAPRGGGRSAQPPLNPIEALDEEFDYKGTSRKEYENAMFNGVCSMILDNFLYLGSDIVAKNYEKLKENGITHVINCAADWSANYHIEKGIKYLPFHLKDHVRENIECCFYEVIEFMTQAHKEGGRVYVHCVQGISRSATFCLCYMIFTQKITLDDGLKFIRERRQIANPNMTFIAQLIQFHKRLYAPSMDSIPIFPRVFLVSSHQEEDPFKISCRFLMENLYIGSSDKTKKLDSRAVFIVQGYPNTPVYIW